MPSLPGGGALPGRLREEPRDTPLPRAESAPSQLCRRRRMRSSVMEWRRVADGERRSRLGECFLPIGGTYACEGHCLASVEMVGACRELFLRTPGLSRSPGGGGDSLAYRTVPPALPLPEQDLTLEQDFGNRDILDVPAENFP